MYPAAPNVEGLPVWLQVVVSMAFVIVTGWAAARGYSKRAEREPRGAAATVLASFPDMSAVRQLNDVCRILCGEVEKLEGSIRDNTHYMRDKIDTDRELCARLRELKEEIIRSDRQRFHER